MNDDFTKTIVKMLQLQCYEGLLLGSRDILPTGPTLVAAATHVAPMCVEMKAELLYFFAEDQR